MKTTNPLINFLVETFQRFFLKSPKFFRVWKIITGIPVLLIALPNALTILNINLPQIFNDHVTDIVGWATTAMFMMSFLPSESKAVAVDQFGTPVKQTNVDKLPFTAVEECKEVTKEMKNINTPRVDKVILENPIMPKLEKL